MVFVLSYSVDLRSQTVPDSLGLAERCNALHPDSPVSLLVLSSAVQGYTFELCHTWHKESALASYHMLGHRMASCYACIPLMVAVNL